MKKMRTEKGITLINRKGRNVVSKLDFNQGLKKSIARVVEGIGGFSSLIKKGERVLLKPNFNTADPPPASTDLKFLKAVIELVYEQGAGKVVVGDCSAFFRNTQHEMKKIGAFSLEKEINPSPQVVNFDRHKWFKKEVPEPKYFRKIVVTECLNWANKLILLPGLKTHWNAKFSGSLKLSVGFMRNWFGRVYLHIPFRNLQPKIAELNKIINPDLILMDARNCFISGGPTKGGVRKPNLILASTDRVAIDIESIKIIQSFEGNSLKGIEPRELPQIKTAIEFGIDTESGCSL